MNNLVKKDFDLIEFQNQVRYGREWCFDE